MRENRKDAGEHLNTCLTPGRVLFTVSHLVDGHHGAPGKFLCAQNRNGAPSHRERGSWYFKSSSGAMESESSLKRNPNPKPRNEHCAVRNAFAHRLLYLETCTEGEKERNRA